MNTPTSPDMRFERALGPAKARLGLTAKERNELSPARLVEAAMRDDRVTLGRFREASDEINRQLGRTPDNFNFYSLAPEALGAQQRDLTKLQGGALVGLESAFYAELRSRSILARLPVEVRDLTGDAYAAVATAASAGWTDADGGQYPDAAVTIGTRAATPHAIGATVTASHQLLQQMSDGARAALDRTLAGAVSQAWEAAIIAGTGADNQPRGIVNIPNVTSQAGSSFSWTKAVALEAAALPYDTGDITWICGTSAAPLLRARARGTDLAKAIFHDDGIGGRPTLVSLACPVSTLIVGPWRTATLCTWSPIEIAVDAFSNFASGKVVIRVRQLVDFNVGLPAAFGKSESIT